MEHVFFLFFSLSTTPSPTRHTTTVFSSKPEQNCEPSCKDCLQPCWVWKKIQAPDNTRLERKKERKLCEVVCLGHDDNGNGFAIDVTRVSCHARMETGGGVGLQAAALQRESAPRVGWVIRILMCRVQIRVHIQTHSKAPFKY